MNSPWTVLAIAIVIFFVELVTRKKITDTIILALIGFLLIGAIFPPFGIMFGVAILVLLFLTRGPLAFGSFGTLGAKKNQ